MVILPNNETSKENIMKNFIRIMLVVLFIFALEVLYIHHRLDARLDRLEQHQARQYLQVEEINRDMYLQLSKVVRSRERNIETIRSVKKRITSPPLIMASY